MKANAKWVLVKRATMIEVTDSGIVLPGASQKPVCYGVIVGVGDQVPEHVKVGDIAWFDSAWQEQFALDPMGDEVLSAIPSTAIYITADADEARELGAKITDEMQQMIGSLKGVATV